jgi:hypothetical protein
MENQAPKPLKVVSIIMIVGGVVMTIPGILLLILLLTGKLGVLAAIPWPFFLAASLIPILFGLLNIKYGRDLRKMKRAAYRGTIILQVVSIIGLVLDNASPGGTTSPFIFWSAYCILIIILVHRSKALLVR